MKNPAAARSVILLFKLRAVLVLALLMVLFSAMMPAFLTLNNLSILSKHVAIGAILPVGMTFVILAGGIDLSVGSIAGLSGMIAGGVLTFGIASHHAGAMTAVVLALGVSCVVGSLNGVLVTRLGVAPFIATLGTLYMARGAALLFSNGKTVPNLGGTGEQAATWFPSIGQGTLLHVPLPVWMAVVIGGFAIVLAAKTPLGRHIYAVGGNERAARLTGISVQRVRMFTYLCSAACAGLVGLVIASQLEAAHPATGESFELNAIAAVVLGGTSLMGGRGSIGGSLIGACVIGVLADGLVMMGISEFWQMVVKGAVIVLAVTIDQLQSRVQARLLPALQRQGAL
jgi:erythritol transport system permease protein